MSAEPNGDDARRTGMTLPPALTRPWSLGALFAVLAAVVVACGSTGKDGGPGGDPYFAAPPQTLGRTYVVSGITEGGKKRALVPGSEIRLSFKDGRLGITAGCNTMSGKFELELTRLTVGSLDTTEMGCDQARMDQDAWVAGLFAKPVQLLTGKDAAIISGGVVLSLVPAQDLHPDASLRGTHWVLDTVIDGETASSVPKGSSGWFQIQGSTVSYDAGCTAGAGEVTVDGPTLRWGVISTQARPCPSGDVVFAAFAAVLKGPATYEISEGNLRITNGEHGLGFHAVRAVR